MPFEDYRIRVGIGEVFEPEIWAVRKGEPDRTAHALTLLQLVHEMSGYNLLDFPSEFAEQGQTLLTYVDEAPEDLYRPLGVRAMHEDWRVKDQVKWKLASMNGKQARKLMDRLIRLYRGVNDEQAALLRGTLATLLDHEINAQIHQPGDHRIRLPEKKEKTRMHPEGAAHRPKSVTFE